MKLKIGGIGIIWIFAIIMAIIYLILPPSLQVKDAEKQEEQEKTNQKSYVLYLPKGNGEFQTQEVLIQEDLNTREKIRAVIQANLEALSQIEEKKIELWNIYQDGKTLYLTMNLGISAKNQAALKKTLADFGIEQEVRILENGK